MKKRSKNKEERQAIQGISQLEWIAYIFQMHFPGFKPGRGQRVSCEDCMDYVMGCCSGQNLDIQGIFDCMAEQAGGEWNLFPAATKH